MQPPASLKALGDPIYEAFYGFSEQPFAISTDPRFFYLSGAHQRAFSELLNGLRRRESLLLLTGETGSGKTTLCRTVLETLGDRTFSAIVLNPYMSGAEVLRIVLRDFGFVSPEDLRRGVLSTADVPQLLDTLEGFLRSVQTLNGHAVVVIDEAQSLQPAVLDQVRMLTALEHQSHRLVQVILCGQPGLAGTVKDVSLQALNERITRRVELSPLTPEDVTGYIQHRMGIAGAGDAVKFDADAMRVIAELSRGLPRRVNVLCDRSLQEGRIEGASVINTDLVKRAARAVAGVHEPVPVSQVAPAKPASAGAGAEAAPVQPPTEPVARKEREEAAQPQAELPTLSFGQPSVAPKQGRLRLVVLVAASVAVLGGGGYAAWAWTAGTAASVVPLAPATRVLNVGEPATARPVPDPAIVDEMYAPMMRRPSAAPADLAEPAVEPTPAVLSGENPNNGN